MSCKYLPLVENVKCMPFAATSSSSGEQAAGENATDEDTITEDAEGKDAVEKML